MTADRNTDAIRPHEDRSQEDETIRKRSVTIAGHRTSLSLEEAFWRALKEIASAEGVSRTALIERIDRTRGGNLSSAVRIHVLNRLRERAGP